MQIIRCNMCGKDFLTEDTYGGLSIKHRFGYPSKFDGDELQVDFCTECMDKEMDRLIKKCVLSPV